MRRGLYRLQGFPRSEHDEMREKWMAVGAGLLRFAVEWLRVDVRVAFGLSVAHIASLVVIVVGVAALLLQRTPRRAG